LIATRWPCIQIVKIIAPYYVVDPFWMSLRGDRVGEATPRHRRPYMEAKYYGHTVADVQQVN